jgi:hypothetical protein
MAAVTQAGQPFRHVLGDLVTRIFTVSGATGSTLDTGQSNILFVAIQQSTAAGSISLITAFAVSGGRITFTTGGSAMVSEVVMVFSRVG